MSDADVTVEQQGAHVAVVCLHRPPNNYFDTALIERRGRGLRRAGPARGGAAPSSWRRRAVTSALGSTSRPTPARTSLRCTAPPCASSPPRSPWWPRCRVRPSAAAAGWRCRPTSGWPRRTPASAPTSRRLGFHHGFALSVTLPAVVGRQAAADLLLTGRRVGGEEALGLGLCDRLADDGDLLAQALHYAGELAAAGPLAVRSIRATLRRDLVEEARLAMEHECAEQLALRDTADFAEGVRAAAERRDPHFSGT